MVLKAIGIVLASILIFLIGSCYIVALISLGVERGLKNYFENKTSKEE